MRFSTASVVALAAGASAQNSTVPAKYTTKVVSYYETYCPYATVVPINGVTYTVTKATTIKVTNCPCTVTYANPAYTPTSVPIVYTSVPVVPKYTTPVAPVVPVVTTPAVLTSAVIVTPPATTTYVAPAPPAGNATVVPVGTGSPASPASPSISAFKGAGSRVAASGASLAAVMGLAAYLL